MIRINLLPVKKARKREAGQRQLATMGVGLLVAVGAIAFVHFDTASGADAAQREVRALEADLAQLKVALGDYEKVKAQREELLRQRKTISGLQAGRTGPVFLLREISEILTRDKGPTFDRLTYEDRLRRDPNVGFNPSWDTRRLWIEGFEESGRQVKVKGAAKSNEDVAEFLKRLQLSVFFSDVAPEGTNQGVSAGAAGLKQVNFSLSAAVIY